MRRAGLVFIFIIMALAGCGADETGLRVTFETDRGIPEELNAVHVQIRDSAGIVSERTFELQPDVPPVVVIARGQRTAVDVGLRVVGLFDGLPVSAPPDLPVSFVRGQIVDVAVTLP